MDLVGLVKSCPPPDKVSGKVVACGIGAHPSCLCFPEKPSVLKSFCKERESITCLSTRGGGVGQTICRLMLGRLLILAISSSASAAVLLHSQGGGGDVVQSQGVELAPAGGGLVGFEIVKAW